MALGTRKLVNRSRLASVISSTHHASSNLTEPPLLSPRPSGNHSDDTAQQFCGVELKLTGLVAGRNSARGDKLRTQKAEEGLIEAHNLTILPMQLARRFLTRTPRTLGKVLPGREILINRSASGVGVRESLVFRSHIPCPAGVVPLYHAKWSSLYDLLTGAVRAFPQPAGDRSYPSLHNRGEVPLSAQAVRYNFGNDWADELTLWHREVFLKSNPSINAAQASDDLALRIERVALTAFSTADLARGLSDGVPEDIEGTFLAYSILDGVDTLKALGDDQFKEKAAVEAERMGWNPEQLMTYVKAVRDNAA